MEKSIRINSNWEFGVYWLRHWHFIGFIQGYGFGKYIGITLKKWKH